MSGLKARGCNRVLFAFILFAGTFARSSTVTFDNPACPSGNGGASLSGIFGGINWGASPWDCEVAGAPTDTTTSISWNRQVTSATFSFTSPSILQSLNAGTETGSGTLTISTDAGESLSQTLRSGVPAVLITTNFTKPATVVTVKFTNGWTLELDNITFSASVPVTIGISPASATVVVNGNQQFTATVQNCGSNCGVNWSVTSGTGTVTQTGLFTAPNNVETDTVRAQAQADSTKVASATVTVAATPPPVSIVVNPANATVGTGASQQFTATVQNCGNNCGVNWSVTQGSGTINQSGLFAAPAVAETDIVQAQAQADTTKMASATVTVNLVIAAPKITAGLIQVQLQANQPVTWSVVSGPGAISTDGLFSEPYGTPPQTTVVLATSIQDTTKSTNYAITVQPQ